MQYRTYKETMLPQMVRLWKEEAVRIRYKAYDSPEEWKAELLDKPDFDPEGCILAFTDSGSLAGFAAAEPGQYAGIYIPSGGKRGI